MLPIGVPGPTRQISSLSDWFSILISSLAPLCADLRCDLRDVLPLESRAFEIELRRLAAAVATRDRRRPVRGVADRKSTRLNSSHQIISYAVFCLKKKKNRACYT